MTRSLLFTLLLAACGTSENAGQPTPPTAPETPPETPPAPAPTGGEIPADLPNGLLISYLQFPNGSQAPGPALLEILTRSGGEWHTQSIEDPESNVFHKAMFYTPAGEAPGILTLGGTAASVKLWRRQGGAWHSQTLWARDFGGTVSRMRDAEIADLYGDGRPAIAVATHDQGVVAVIRGTAVTELDHQANTIVHEIEIGDLDHDGVLEVYATPSEPNNLNGGAQHGTVVRYLPRNQGARTVVADLGNRHAKEIYVGDVDGDGRDELYVAVEALTEGSEIREPVEIRRYDHDTAPNAGVVIARIQDRFCRFLTVGDIDGDGHREMVAAAFSSGLWLLRPGRDPHGAWSQESIDRNSGGFEHASLLADLDGDHVSELYVASDEQGELRRYVWVNGRPRREVILRRDNPRSRMTWNLMPVPVSLTQ